MRVSGSSLAGAALSLAFSLGVWDAGHGAPTPEKPSADRRTVKARVQLRPGGPLEEVDLHVHPVPTDLPTVPAAEAHLEEQELVLGVVLDGEAMAYPIRFLALYEIVDHRAGKTPVAPSW